MDGEGRLPQFADGKMILSGRCRNRVFRGREGVKIEIAYFREFRQDIAATFSSAVS